MFPKALAWQRGACHDIVRALTTHGAGINCSDTGLGKTYMTLASLAHLRMPFAVLCPKVLIDDWQRTSAEFGLKPLFASSYESALVGSHPYISRHGDSFVYRNLSPNSVVVFDEAHRGKSPTGVTSRLIMASRLGGGGRTGALLLSATLAESPLDLKAVGSLLGLYKGGKEGFLNWVGRYGVSFSGFNNALEFTGGENGLKMLHKDLFPRFGTRLRWSDSPDFPQTVISPVLVDLENLPAVTDAYKALAEVELQAIQESLDHEDEVGAPLITELLRFRQLAEIGKLPAMSAMADEALAEGASVAVFLNFKASIKLYQALRVQATGKEPPPVICGETKPEDRTWDVQMFRDNSLRELILQVQAGGAGISLHDTVSKVTRVSLISPNYNARDFMQIKGRVHRQGGGFSVQKLVFAKGTIEEAVYAAVKRKSFNIETLNDGDFRAGLFDTEPSL